MNLKNIYLLLAVAGNVLPNIFTARGSLVTDCLSGAKHPLGMDVEGIPRPDKSGQVAGSTE